MNPMGKMIAVFALGAVMAAALVLTLVQRPTAPAPAPSAVVQLPPQALPPTTPVVETPAPLPPPPPEEKPSPAPKIVANVPAKPKPRPTPTVPAKPVPAPVAATPAPVQEPVKVAENTTPKPAPAPADGIPKLAPLPPAPPPPPPPPPRVVTIQPGATLSVRINETISSDTAASGDRFTASLDTPLVVDGLVIAEHGARVEGHVVDALQSGRVKGLAQVSLALDSVKTSDGQKIRIRTESDKHVAESSVKEDVAKAGAVAGIGAIIGAIAGGGKGAAIGAAAGGAAGAGGVMTTRGKPVRIPAETRLVFRIADQVTITEKR